MTHQREHSQNNFELRNEKLAALDANALWCGGSPWQPSGGRGAVTLVSTPLGEGVLKHYQRGGWLASLLGDRYFYTDTESSRSFAEFRLLLALFESGLPVPQPLAARIQVNGWFYRAELITQRLIDTCSLHDWLSAAPPTLAMARAVGATLARFHRIGLYHADLNAHNILLRGHEVYLIDFDRSHLLAPNARWQQANLGRLKRSLKKLGHLSDAVSEAPFWRPLWEAHAAAVRA
jgi:3-deoxy-D-manno-octulosonic acid kinase